MAGAIHACRVDRITKNGSAKHPVIVLIDGIGG